MKNNVKYAGIAAAALLAVAPIATPIVSSTNNVQTAQAATSDLTAAQKASVEKLLSEQTLRTTTNATDEKPFPDFSGVTANYDSKKLSYTDLMGLAPIIAASNSTILPDDVKNINDAGVTFSVQGIVNGKVANKQDFNTSLDYAQKNNGTVILRVTAYTADGTSIDSKDLSFVNSKATTEDVKQISVNYTNPYSVAVNSSTSAPKYTTSVDVHAADQKGNDIKLSNPTPSQQLYTTSQAALGNDASKEYNSSTFDQAGKSYFQAVTVSVDPAAKVGDVYTSMQQGQGGSITLNGQSAIAANVDGKNNTITFVREILVGDTTTTPDNGTWKETTAPGVVTVNASIAHLYDDNNTLTSRSLASATGWQTDKYRTNSKTGIVQYHVSTHEWVNATDVSFKDSSVSGDGLGNVQNLDGNHIVSLAGPSGFVYTLYKLEGGTGNRGLAGDTAWLCNQTATDSQGRTYYRVSTNEWIREGTGVSFK